MSGFMQLGRVVGHATATVKHPSLNGWRLLLVQPLTAGGAPDGEPQLMIDTVGSALGSLVVASSEGTAARQAMGSKNSPVRWMVLGMCDR
jgi:ethanolamine utilization protein EutN